MSAGFADEKVSAEQFADRVFQATLGAQEVQAVFLGSQLGWYKALVDNGSLTATELASATNTNERYAQEWLEHQAASGYVMVDDASADSKNRRYSLQEGQAEVLADPDSMFYFAATANLVAAVGGQIHNVTEAYKYGGGVSWEEFGDSARLAQAAANRPMFLHALGQELLPQAPRLHERLRGGGRVAEIGCGAGWASIGLAKSYPKITIDAYDIDAPSVELAQINVNEAGVEDRVTVKVADGADVPELGYDVVFAFECVHDMPDPVAVLSQMRRMARAEGMVIIMDELSQANFTAPASETERLLYGFSLMCCLPDSMSTTPSRATGTVMRPSTLAQYAGEAGFSNTEILPVESDLFRFYCLHQ